MTTLVECIKSSLISKNDSFDFSVLPDRYISIIVSRFVSKNRIRTIDQVSEKDFKKLFSAVKAKIKYLATSKQRVEDREKASKLKIENARKHFLDALDDVERTKFLKNLNSSFINNSAFAKSIANFWNIRGTLTSAQYTAFMNAALVAKKAEACKDFYKEYEPKKSCTISVKLEKIIENFEVQSFNNRGIDLVSKFQFSTPEQQIIILYTSSVKVEEKLKSLSGVKTFTKIDARVKKVSANKRFVIISSQGLKIV